MKMKCCKCGKTWANAKKLAPGLPKGAVSHGLCEFCAKIMDKEIDILIRRKNEIPRSDV